MSRWRNLVEAASEERPACLGSNEEWQARDCRHCFHCMSATTNLYSNTDQSPCRFPVNHKSIGSGLIEPYFLIPYPIQKIHWRILKPRNAEKPEARLISEPQHTKPKYLTNQKVQQTFAQKKKRRLANLQMRSFTSRRCR